MAAYDYRDESGTLLYQAVRFDPKGFSQRRPDGKGGWLDNIDGVRRVLYRLPELLGVDRAAPVYVVEGEKDVDALAGLGLVATTNPMGAGKWRSEYNEVLRGRRVVILPDNDKKGRKHAEQVMQSIIDFAVSVKIVSLPDLPETGDVSDWLKAGRTREQLEAIITASDALPDAHLTDLGNAQRLVQAHGMDLRFCTRRGGWFMWDGCRWALDETDEVMRRAKATVRAIYGQAVVEKEEHERKRYAAHAMKSEARRALDAMVALASSESGIPLRVNDLDAAPWTLNVKNGTLDLRMGTLRPHARTDYITKLAPVIYDPAAIAPTWDTFLARIFTDNRDLIVFMQKAVGYALTGDTTERVLFILWGSGKNGKSTFLETVRAVLGDYAMRTPVQTLLAKRGDAGIPNDIARLVGARFVTASEADEGKRLAEATVKDLTGGDTICARFLNREFFEFKPEFKLWLATNHKPIIRGTDLAIWDRIRLVPFTVRIPEPEQDPHLLGKLVLEAPGILRWAVEGCTAWQRDGLKAPDPVRTATEGYRAEMDVLGGFITDVCVEDPRAEVTAADLYAAFTKWSDENGERPVPQREFGLRLTERGFAPKHKRNGILRLGIGLRKAGVNLVKDREPISGVLSQIPPHEEEHRKSLHHGSQGSPTTPCRICRQTVYHRAGDGYACSTCHPPPTTGIPSRTGIGWAGSGRQ